MSTNSDGVERRSDAFTEFEVALSHLASTVWGLAKQPSRGGLVSLSVYCRGDRDILAVARRVRGSGDVPEVAFGGGESLAGALANLHKAISAEKWREDKPYQTK